MHIRCFTGDGFLRERALQKLIAALSAKHKDLQKTQFYGDELDLARLREELDTGSLFGGAKLIVIRHADRAPAELAELLERHAASRETYVLLEAEKLDRRGKLYKFLQHKKALENYPPPDRQRLPGIVRELLHEHGLELSPEARRYLIEIAGLELRRIANEIKKLALYPHEKVLEPRDLEVLIWGSSGGGLFRFLDGLSERQDRCLLSLKELLAAGEDPNKIFFMIVAQVRALLMTKSLAGEGRKLGEIAAQTGQPPWLARKRLVQSANFSEEELLELLDLLHQEDLLLKRGEREPVEALFRVAMFVLSNSVRAAVPRRGGTPM